ncbi:hypothetical protein HYV64_03825 [Candidatus Shapirobacteria bacterium]|nr:hypothetical protein [Candidatus Shapirobacteria bacterium]
MNGDLKNWNYTENAKVFVSPKKKLFFDKSQPEVATYQGMPLIHRDGPINGGIFVMSDGKNIYEEACYVDDRKMPILHDIYRYLLARIDTPVDKNKFSFKDRVLKPIAKIVEQYIPYSEKKLTVYNQGFSSGEPVGLDYYINNHVGVCRHESLLAGYLTQRLTADQLLRGKASLDRNLDEELGGHAWVRYTNPKSAIYVIDVANDGFAGTLAEANQTFNRNYNRPEDH